MILRSQRLRADVASERLWTLIDEPVVNQCFATLNALDAVVAQRCRELQPHTIKARAQFAWWPKPVTPLITRIAY